MVQITIKLQVNLNYLIIKIKYKIIEIVKYKEEMDFINQIYKNPKK
jgi:hypothetical protein